MTEVSTSKAGEVDGVEVAKFTLSNATGMQVTILPWGGIIQSVSVPDRHGAFSNVALGFADLHTYVSGNLPFFGCLTGRYANRIAGGQFTLDGQIYDLPKNVGGNVTLHGGVRGFDKYLMTAEPLPDGVRLSRVSPDGEEGFPGALAVSVTYRLSDDNQIRVNYAAVTDKPTVLNLTNHSYWNLAGEGCGSADDHLLTVRASCYTPTGYLQVPTGELAPVAGTPFDFTTAARFGDRARMDHPQVRDAMGIDHNFIIDRPAGDAELREAAILVDPGSGRQLTVLTTEPAIQVYGGNHLDGTLYGSSGRAYRQGDGIALETQHYPDSPNRPEFPTTVLRPGEAFHSTTVFAFSLA